jgi:hypothetical protein
VARREEFGVMLQSVAKHCLGLKPPSCHYIRVKYLKQEVQATNEALAESTELHGRKQAAQ